jgi:hypothetical protein
MAAAFRGDERRDCPWIALNREQAANIEGFL